MLEETLRDDFDKYLKNPSNERLQKLTNAIQRFHEKRLACPQCKHDDVYMITYNLFRERKFKIDDEKVWMTPFQLAGAKYTDAQEAWDILKDFL